MYQFRKTVGGMALSLLLSGTLAGPATLEAQVTVPDASDGRWPLQPTSPGNNTLAPFGEGWYANPDGGQRGVTCWIFTDGDRRKLRTVVAPSVPIVFSFPPSIRL